MNIKEWKRGVAKWDFVPYVIRVRVMRGKREEVESLKKDKPCLTKMMTPSLACGCGMGRENTRPRVSAIRSQSRESRDPEGSRWVKVGFLIQIRSTGWDEISIVVQCFWLPAFHWITLSNLGWEEETGGIEKLPRAWGSGVWAEGEDTKWAEGE